MIVTYLCNSQLSEVPWKFFRVFPWIPWPCLFVLIKLETAPVTDSKHAKRLQGYYYCTPLPVLADSLPGLDFRISRLQGANIINFILSGGELLAAFYSAQRRLLQQR